MKRSDINQLVRDASACFAAHGWTLPPKPRWDVTDFGLGDWREFGLVLVNLAEEPEYCEKLMYAKRGMQTPAHAHAKKKEDIICRWGELRVWIWIPGMKHLLTEIPPFALPVNGESRDVILGEPFTLRSGERVTLVPGIIHAFEPVTDECIIGEVSTANDDLNDNFFEDVRIGRFSRIDEDEEAVVKLVSDS